MPTRLAKAKERLIRFARMRGPDHERIAELEAAIRKVCTQKLDDLCWMDLYDLAEVGGCEMPDLRLLSKQEMMRNCDVYTNCLLQCPNDRGEALRQYKERNEPEPEYRPGEPMSPAAIRVFNSVLMSRGTAYRYDEDEI